MNSRLHESHETVWIKRSCGSGKGAVMVSNLLLVTNTQVRRVPAATLLTLPVHVKLLQLLSESRMKILYLSGQTLGQPPFNGLSFKRFSVFAEEMGHAWGKTHSPSCP